MNHKIRTMVGIGLFTAIVVVLQFLGGGIKLGAFSISLVLLPIVVGSALYTWRAGAILGLAFGVAVLMSGDAASFMAVNPLGTILVVLLKGTMCGLVSGIVYSLLKNVHKMVAVVAAAIVCPIVNTGIFLLGCIVFFMPTITEWASAFGFANAGSYMILGLVGINFLIELGVNIVLSPVIIRLIDLGKNN